MRKSGPDQNPRLWLIFAPRQWSTDKSNAVLAGRECLVPSSKTSSHEAEERPFVWNLAARVVSECGLLPPGNSLFVRLKNDENDFVMREPAPFANIVSSNGSPWRRNYRKTCKTGLS